MATFCAEYVESRHFSVLPHYLEDYLFRSFSSATTVWVFRIFYREGQMRGDWCAEIPVRILVKLTGRAESSINRAIQQLVDHGLIKRHLSKKSSDPREEAVAITQLLCPRDLKAAFERAPARRVKATKEPETISRSEGSDVDTPKPCDKPSECNPPPTSNPKEIDGAPLSLSQRLRQQQSIEARLADHERQIYATAYRSQDPQLLARITSLSPSELNILAAGIPTRAEPEEPSSRAPKADQNGPVHREGRGIPQEARAPDINPVAVLQTKELTKEIADDDQSAITLANEVIWAAIHGCLAAKPFRHARNIALKLIKEGRWERPWGMPGDWCYTTRNRTYTHAR